MSLLGFLSQMEIEQSMGYSTPAVASCSHMVALLKEAQQSTKDAAGQLQLTVMIAGFSEKG